MRFEWDEKKRRLNLEKHSLDFSDAPELFEAPMLAALDTRYDYGEDRYVAIGSLKGRIVVVVFTQPYEATVRIVSLRKAVKSECTRYEESLRNRLG